jgi:CSLREA domain-containing protein
MRIRTGVALAASVALAAAANAHAATFTVTRLDDPAPGTCDSDCSLREAVLAANAGSGGDTIVLPVGLFRLTRGGAGEDAASTGDLDLTKSVTITGAGARSTTIDAAGLDRVFDVRPGVTALIADVAVSGGFVGVDGGGIENLGVLTLVRDSIRGNEAMRGGGIDSNGTLTLTDTTVSGNRASSGGGVEFNGTLTLTSSTVSGNVAGSPSSSGAGGGITGKPGASLTAESSTIAHNAAFGAAGSGGGIKASLATLRNTIVASNVSHPTDQSATSSDNCSITTVTTQGHNLSDGADCGLTGTGDQQSADPRLSGLGDHGGQTDTEALFPGSTAIDAGGDCGMYDQRGTPRPRGGACDIGAYEVAPPIVETRPATALALRSVVLTGLIDPGAQNTSFRFEWGVAASTEHQTAFQSAPAFGGPTAVAAFLTGLLPGTTYTYRLVASNAEGTTIGGELTFTTLDRTKPVLTLLKVAPGIFRAAKGTKISFTLSEAATVTFKVDRVLPGVRKGSRCVPLTARRRRGRACTRYVPVKGTLVQAATTGGNVVGFDAKLGGKTLVPGAYRLSASPRDPGMNVGKTAITAFRVRR